MRGRGRVAVRGPANDLLNGGSRRWLDRRSGFRFGCRRSLDEGRIWVFVAPARSSRWRAVRLTLRALFKRDRRDRDFNVFQTRELRVETTREQVRVALDGEIFRVPPPLRYRSRPLALRVRVPAGKG